MSLSMQIQINLHINRCEYTSAYVYVYNYTCTHTSTRTYTPTYTHTSTDTYTYTSTSTCTYTSTEAKTHVYTHSHVHIFIFVDIYICPDTVRFCLGEHVDSAPMRTRAGCARAKSDERLRRGGAVALHVVEVPAAHENRLVHVRRGDGDGHEAEEEDGQHGEGHPRDVGLRLHEIQVLISTESSPNSVRFANKGQESLPSGPNSENML